MNVKRFITAAAALALGLGACSSRPGVALIVDGKEYRTAEIERTARETSQITQSPVPNAVIVDFLSRLEATQVLAKQIDVDISMEKVRAELEKDLPEGSAPISDLTVQTFYVNSVLRTLSQKMGPQAFSQAFLETQANHKIEINPRFGTVSDSGTMLPLVLTGVLDQRTQEAKPQP